MSQSSDYFDQQSSRLIYRKLQLSDIESWKEFFYDNDRLHFMGMDLSKEIAMLAHDWIHTQLHRYQEHRLGHLAVIQKNSGAFIGMGGILPREIEGKKELEIS